VLARRRSNVVDTTAILFITSLLQQTDFIYAMPTEVARYYTQARLMDILPIELLLPHGRLCIITRQDNPLSPGANLVLQAIREVAKMIY
jgi:DNA-binding transcriptional LysR family regulator